MIAGNDFYWHQAPLQIPELPSNELETVKRKYDNRNLRFVYPHDRIDITFDNQSFKYIVDFISNYDRENLKRHKYSTIQTTDPISYNSQIFYFELTILNSDPLLEIAMGLCEKPVDVKTKNPTFKDLMYHNHWHSIPILHRHSSELIKLKGYKCFDTVGVGYVHQTSEQFFTKNGVYLGKIKMKKKNSYYPTVCATSHCCIQLNMGHTPFMYTLPMHDAVPLYQEEV